MDTDPSLISDHRIRNFIPQGKICSAGELSIPFAQTWSISLVFALLASGPYLGWNMQRTGIFSIPVAPPEAAATSSSEFLPRQSPGSTGRVAGSVCAVVHASSRLSHLFWVCDSSATSHHGRGRAVVTKLPREHLWPLLAGMVAVGAVEGRHHCRAAVLGWEENSE